MKRLFCAGAFALATLTGCSAQSLSLDSGGLSVSDGGLERHAAEPIRVGRELAMHEIPVVSFSPLFYLGYGTNRRAGPFELMNGATVGSKRNPYTLNMLDYGMRFNLRSGADTNAVFGPFTATNGAPILLGDTAFTLIRPPPDVRIAVRHPDRAQQSPFVGFAPYSPALTQSLYELRAKYAALANRVDNDTASATMQGVPRIRSGLTGNATSPVVKTSPRDKLNAIRGSEQSAMAFLQPLLERHFCLRPQASPDGATFRIPLEPGDYVMCVTQHIKVSNAGSLSGTVTAVWWTTVHPDGEHPLALELSAENAITWREIFTFPR